MKESADQNDNLGGRSPSTRQFIESLINSDCPEGRGQLEW